MLFPIPINKDTAQAMSGPITKLIEVIGQGCGKIYSPVGTIVDAKAEAIASVIRAEADMKVRELQARAIERVLTIEGNRQRNYDAIFSAAARHLPETVSDAPVSSDWMMSFIDNAKDISDEHMRDLWGRILAGEVAKPGQTRRRTLDALRTMERDEAEMFSFVVNFSIQYHGWFRIFDDESVFSLMNSKLEDTTGHSLVRHLVSIGLLAAEPSLYNASDASGVKLTYGKKSYLMKGPQKPGPDAVLTLEKMFSFRSFTSVGQQLAQFVTVEPVDQLIQSLSASLSKDVGVSIEEVGGL